jgi:hypothetical protein
MVNNKNKDKSNNTSRSTVQVGFPTKKMKNEGWEEFVLTLTDANPIPIGF